MARILFLYPSLISGWASYVEHGNNESSYMDHGAGMISAVLKRAGHETFSMDLRSFKSWEHFESILKTQSFDVTLVTWFTANDIYAKQAIEIVKRNFPNKLIIAGGVHLSVTKTRSYPNVDTIVLGEGEPHIVEIIDIISKGGKPKPVYDLKMVEKFDELPYVDRALFNRRMEETSPLLEGLPTPFITIVAGRGCWGRCTFCAPSRSLINGNKTRIRSVDHFLGEIIQIHKEVGGIGSLMIHDDLLGTAKWLTEFIDKWKKNLPRIPFWCQLRADTILKISKFIPDLAEIGMSYVSIGLESGSQRMLDFLKKGTTVQQNIDACKLLHDNDINIFANYIMGLPTETEEDLIATDKMLEITKPAYLASSIYTSYPGSYLYDWIIENNYWVGDDENLPENHYSMHRFPYERKIKGVNYDKIFERQKKHAELYKGDMRYWKPKNNFAVDNSVTKDVNLNVFKRPKVSVIIVTYNRPEMLKTAIDSILSQTLTDWELIVNDYTENWSINKQLYDEHAKNPKIKWLRHIKNINNISLCWNEALDIARGEYWCTLDDDNTKYPEFLEKMSKYLDENNDKLAVVCPMKHTGYNSGVFYKKPTSYADLKNGNKIDSGQVMYRITSLEAIGNFDERCIAYDDWDYILRVYALNNESGSAFGWLDGEPLCTYSWHDSKRMFNKEIEVITDKFGSFVVNKASNNLIFNNLKVAILKHPDNNTESQNQVYQNILEAIKSLKFVTITNSNPDIIIISGTLYNYSTEFIQKTKSDFPNSQIVALLVEEPQAYNMNLKYAEWIDWYVVNDINSYNNYIKTLQGEKSQKVLFWNCLSISNNLLNYINKYNPKKIYDICLVGYAYDSRAEWLRELSKLLPDLKICLIGNKWEESGIKADIFSTKDELETAKLAMQSKITLLRHRTQKDIGGFPIEPSSVNRGYIEVAYKNVVMIDDSRKNHSFADNTVIFYDNNDVKDCADKIKFILKNYSNYDFNIKKQYQLAVENFTHKTRLMKVLNCIRSVRYNKIIE